MATLQELMALRAPNESGVDMQGMAQALANVPQKISPQGYGMTPEYVQQQQQQEDKNFQAGMDRSMQANQQAIQQEDMLARRGRESYQLLLQEKDQKLKEWATAAEVRLRNAQVARENLAIEKLRYDVANISRYNAFLEKSWGTPIPEEHSGGLPPGSTFGMVISSPELWTRYNSNVEIATKNKAALSIQEAKDNARRDIEMMKQGKKNDQPPSFLKNFHNPAVAYAVRDAINPVWLNKILGAASKKANATKGMLPDETRAQDTINEEVNNAARMMVSFLNSAMSENDKNAALAILSDAGYRIRQEEGGRCVFEGFSYNTSSGSGGGSSSLVREIGGVLQQTMINAAGQNPNQKQ